MWSWSRWRTTALVALGLGATGAGVMMLLRDPQRLEIADKLASVLALVVGVVAFFVSLAGRRPAPGAMARREFAGHLRLQLEILASREEWKDRRYAELEAEVELEGRERTVRWWPSSPSRRTRLRRERSLTRALARSRERLIVLEGNPGAGKSVALRHLASALAARAEQGGRRQVPLYLNLKHFPAPNAPMSAATVRDFILTQLNQVNDRDVDEFLQTTFDRGLREGRWLLLFDSFDEIPEVLSATDAGGTVNRYATAIREFVEGGLCRAVIASRQFHGPKLAGLPVFRILNLTGRQQRVLISRFGLDREARRALFAGLAALTSGADQMTTNPMFLSLLCAYVKRHRRYPETPYSAYDSYLGYRFERDAERVQQRFGVTADMVRDATQEIAFSMTAAAGLGLSPTRAALRQAVAEEGRLPADMVDRSLDTLVYLKLGRDDAEITGGSVCFTFVHRRIQEYFATRAVIADGSRVEADVLLSNGRWRETAVTILQTQPHTVISALLVAAYRRLPVVVGPQTAEEPFAWPAGSLHLLGILAAGLVATPERAPTQLRQVADALLLRAWRVGRRHDRVLAIEHVVVATTAVAEHILRQASTGSSSMLREVAYRSLGSLPSMPEDIALGVRRTLVRFWAVGELYKHWALTRAQLQRLPGSAAFLAVQNLLPAIIPIELALLLLDGAAVVQLDPGAVLSGWLWSMCALLALLHAGLYLLRDGRADVAGSDRRAHWFSRLLPRALSDAELLALVGRVVRVAAAAAVIVLLAVRPGPPTAFWVPAALTVYACLWADSALDRVVRGGSTRLGRWPLLPLPWRGRTGLRVPAVLATVLILVVAVSAIGAAIYAIGLIHVPSGRTAPQAQAQASSDPPRWLEVVVLTGVVLAPVGLIVVFGAIGVNQVRRVLGDRRRARDLRSWITGHPRPFAAMDVYDVLDNAESERALRVLVHAMSSHPAHSTDLAVEALSDLAAGAERARGAGDATWLPPGAAPHFAAWVARDPRWARSVARMLSDDALDEIALLVRQRQVELG